MAVNACLASLKLQAADVIGDGNCFFRSISVGICGDQSLHTDLRRRTATHMATNYASLFNTTGMSSVDAESVHRCVARIERANTEVGEECILTAADLLRRPIHVYKFVKPGSSGTSPTVYAPTTGTAAHAPIALAFYEPGHYCAVLPASSLVTDNLNLQQESPSPCDTDMRTTPPGDNPNAGNCKAGHAQTKGLGNY
jgi:hypothetical protein